MWNPMDPISLPVTGRDPPPSLCLIRGCSPGLMSQEDPSPSQDGSPKKALNWVLQSQSSFWLERHLCVAITSEYSLYRSLVFFFPLSLSPALSLLLSFSPSPRLPLSPHLMRPHNNTAVVQLFCYLSQTAGSLHSVFLVPFTCLLRQGNEYHLELQSTSPQKGWSVISGYTSEAFGRGSQTSNQSISKHYYIFLQAFSANMSGRKMTHMEDIEIHRCCQLHPRPGAVTV